VLRAMFGKVEAGSDVEMFKKIVGEEIRQERDPETNTVLYEYMDEEAYTGARPTSSRGRRRKRYWRRQRRS